MAQIDFFYFFGSCYAYLSAMRIDRLADAADVTVRWRPFNVRTVMSENNIALRTQAAKVRYMYRDIERRCLSHGIQFVEPPIWPTDPDLLANRVGVVAAKEGWCEAYTKASLKAWFLDHQALGEPASLTRILTKLGKDPPATLELAQSDEIAAAFAAETDIARSYGIFGSPSFVVDGEMFWGDDRLEEAIAWATNTHHRQQRA